MLTTGRRQFFRYLGIGTLISIISLPARGQKVELDLKALFQQRIDELSKLSEQIFKGKPVDASTMIDVLKELKKAFDSGKAQDTINQLNLIGTLLRALKKVGIISDLEETMLRSSFYRLVEAFVLFSENVGKISVKILVARYVGGEKGDKEEILAPILNECAKSLIITNKNGVKETFTLKECKSL